jgi:hypothetical protein
MKRVVVRRWTIVAVLTAMVALPAGAWVVATSTRENHDLLQAIQAERAKNIRRSCEEQNARHDQTVDTLNRLVVQRLTHRTVPASVKGAQLKVLLAGALRMADPPVRAQMQQSIGSTVLLIESLAPHRDCSALVAQQVKAN